MGDYSHTELLFARPSFLSGAARVLDFAGTMNTYNNSRTADEADARALASDWESVGRDIRNSMQRESDEQKKSLAANRPPRKS